MASFDLDGSESLRGSRSDRLDRIVRDRGLSFDASLVGRISSSRGEPEWMEQQRMRSLRVLRDVPLGEWFAANAPGLDVSDVVERVRRQGDQAAGAGAGAGGAVVAAAAEDARVHHRNREGLEALGVLFCDMYTAVREHADLVQRYFGTVVGADDDVVAALGTVAWSAGSFVYVPPGVEVDVPLQAYTRDEAAHAGPFERTLIIADTGSAVCVVDGCSAPLYSSESLRAAVVEIVVGDDASVDYTTIQNWSSNVHNLVAKRASVGARGRMRWIDANIGSKVTIGHPVVHLAGDDASGSVRSLASAGAGQHQRTGAEVIHSARNTSAEFVARSIARNGGAVSVHSVVQVEVDAAGAVTRVQCDGLELDGDSAASAGFTAEVDEPDALIERTDGAATISDAQRFYLQSRGLSETQAVSLVVDGFVQPITRMLPVEYAVEWSRLIGLQIEGSVG